MVLVPFYRGAVVFREVIKMDLKFITVLVPFYRGAVVFELTLRNVFFNSFGSRPLLSRSGCILVGMMVQITKHHMVLVPFYRGAVVFNMRMMETLFSIPQVLVPFYRGAVVFKATF